MAKVHLEYPLNGNSRNIIWNFIGTIGGLEAWMADKITECNGVYTFQWGKEETREAELLGCREGVYIRFHWLDDEEAKSYFELKIVYNELTEDLMLEVIDWAEPGEKEDVKDLWDSDIDKLRRVSGL